MAARAFAAEESNVLLHIRGGVDLTQQDAERPRDRATAFTRRHSGRKADSIIASLALLRLHSMKTEAQGDIDRPYAEHAPGFCRT